MARYAVVSKSIKQRKRRKFIYKMIAIVVIAVILSVLLALWIYWRSMAPVILDVAETRLLSETTFAVNEAVCVALADCDGFSDFVLVEKNNKDEIVMISANSALVNNLARNTALLSQQKINSLKSFNVKIPLGTLSGIPLLSEKGPTVNVIVSPIGNVSCTYTSTFETAGINQTLHRIYINVNSKVDLIMPMSHLEVECSTPILVCESVIVGSVPDTFLQGSLLLGST